MIAKQRSEAGLAVRGGLVGGVVGGTVSYALMLLMAAMQRADAWQMLKGAGTPFLGERALAPGFDAGAVIVGVLSHYAVSVAWGLLFGLIFWGLSKPATIAAGAFWGVIVWLGMYYVVLPILGLGRLVAGAPVGMAVLNHVVFGVAVALGFLPYQRELPAGERRILGWRRRASVRPPD